MTAAEKMAGKKCLLTEGSGGQQQRRRADHSDAKRQACCCHLISASRCYHHKAPERGDLFSFLLFLPNFFLVIFPFFAPLIVFPQKSGARLRLRLITVQSISEYRKSKMACLQQASCTCAHLILINENCNAASCKNVPEQNCLSTAYISVM